MTWTEQQTNDYWAKRYNNTREQLIKDLPEEEYQPEYPLIKSDQNFDFRWAFELARRTKNGILIPTIPKIDDYYIMTNENDVRDWRDHD